MGRFAKACRRRGLKVNACKSKGMVLGGEEGMECEVCVDGIHLEHISEFKYLGCVLDEAGTDEAECSRNVSCKTLAHSSCKPLALTRDLMAPATLLTLATFLLHSARSVHDSSKTHPKHSNSETCSKRIPST